MVRSTLNVPRSLFVGFESLFDELEGMMLDQMHLTDPDKVEEKLYAINYKWEFISEEDRDFYQGCQYALEHGLKW